jgi:GAF domain-containing protein
MRQTDYLSAFAEANRAICEGANERMVMNLITRRVTETLNLKGCLIKLKPGEIERVERKSDALKLGGSTYRIQFPEEERLELLSSFGLSEDFIYSKIHSSHDSLFYRIPQKTIAIADIEKKEKNVDYDAVKAEGIRAILMFPIEVNRENVALVALFDDKVGELSSEDVKFARAITSRGVMAFIYLRNWDRMLDRERQFLNSFQEVSSAISSTLTINKVLQLVVTKITEVLGVRGAQVRLLDRKTNQLQLAATYGLSEKFLKIGALKAKRGKNGARKLSAKAIIIDDAHTDPRVQYRSELIEEGIRKMLTLPLIVRDRIIGELTIFTGESLAVTKQEIQFTTAIAQQCAFAIENSRMYQQVKYEFQKLLEDFGYEGSST